MRQALHHKLTREPFLKELLWWPPPSDLLHPTCLGHKCALPIAASCWCTGQCCAIEILLSCCLLRRLCMACLCRYMADQVIGFLQDIAAAVMAVWHRRELPHREARPACMLSDLGAACVRACHACNMH